MRYINSRFTYLLTYLHIQTDNPKRNASDTLIGEQRHKNKVSWLFFDKFLNFKHKNNTTTLVLVRNISLCTAAVYSLVHVLVHRWDSNDDRFDPTSIMNWKELPAVPACNDCVYVQTDGLRVHLIPQHRRQIKAAVMLQIFIFTENVLVLAVRRREEATLKTYSSAKVREVLLTVCISKHHEVYLRNTKTKCKI